jgi:archaellum biogenesis protein FlaJ (TadC family)
MRSFPSNGSLACSALNNSLVFMIEPMLFLQVLVWLVMLGVFLASGQASIFHSATMYLAFHGVVFVIRPILVYYMEFDSVWRYIGYRPDEADFIRALGVSSVALIAFVGACLYFGRSRVQFTPKPPPLLTPVQSRALLWTTLILLPYIAASIVESQIGGGGERAQ